MDFIFRIFPVYCSLIVVYIFILPYLNDGPYWKIIVYKEVERCQKNWWTNVLFINNYINTDEQVNINIYLYYLSELMFICMCYLVHYPILVLSMRYAFFYNWYITHIHNLEMEKTRINSPWNIYYSVNSSAYLHNSERKT